ncbi:DUF349 domain-containing protein [Marinobacter salicampi]|uniref:DUF349 domain-containing protein n=1 Tax=Marinobacter salicampi TaxID=435907 RepID=UPI00140BDC93|nr:DUF349 domain-containing protein [Marinobacter salicampi]
MAAFIQRLFRGRKTAKPSSPAKAPVKAPDVQAQAQAQAQDMVAEQRKLLQGYPTTQQLETLALEGKAADIRLTAAESLNDREALQRLQKAARGRDKNVYQVVRQKLQQIRDIESEQQRLAQMAEDIVHQAEEHARTENTRLYEARLENLLKHWKDAESLATPEQAAKFLRAVHQSRERINAQRYEQEQEQIHANKAVERNNTLELMKATIEELKAQPEDHLASLAALDAMQKTQENRWLEATRETQVEKAEQRAYEALMHALRGYISAVQRFSQHTSRIDELLGEASTGAPPEDWHAQAQTILEELAWPDGFTRPTTLTRLSMAIAEARPTPAPKAEQQTSQVAELETMLEKLEAALEARQLKPSRQLFKQAQSLHRSLDARHGRPLQARLQLLSGQLHELQDWQGFATQPKQIELCEHMEHLADQPLEPEIKAEKIKELQNEWRELGGSSDRTLWQRFKAASDRAYEPCKEYFSAKSGLKKNNLATRETICDELELFVRDTDWNQADWKAVEQIHRVARDEWKSAWPVDFRDNRPLQKRFDDLLGRVEEPLNRERDKNEALKQDIVERAQALVNHDPLPEAMNQAKSLQTEWKAIGITRHRQDRKLWQTFRAACDQVFARRAQEKEEQQSQTRAAEEHLGQLLEHSAGLALTENDEDLPDLTEVTAALAGLKDAQSQPSSAAMTSSLRGETERLSGVRDSLILRQQAGQWQALIWQRAEPADEAPDYPAAWQAMAQGYAGTPARDLVIRAEILTTVPSPEADQARRMEIQVRRLAEGMSGSGAGGTVAKQMENLVAAWCIATPDNEITEELTKRLSSAVDAALARPALPQPG